MSQGRSKDTKIRGERNTGDGKATTLEDFFGRSMVEYTCCVCGQEVKEGRRRTHEKDCRMPLDDEDVVFVEEVKATQEAISEPVTSTPKQRRMKRQRSSDEKEFIPSQDKEENGTEHIEPWSKRLRCRSPSDGRSTPSIISSGSTVRPIKTSVSISNEPSTSDLFRTEDSFIDTCDVSASHTDADPHLQDCLRLFDQSDFDDKPGCSKTIASDNAVGNPVIVSVRSLALQSQQSQEIEIFEDVETPAAEGDTVGDSEDELDVSQQFGTGSTPFIVSIFTVVLNRVFEDEFHSHLFNSKDRKIINDYKKFPDEAKLLFCRLMTRRNSWRFRNQLVRFYGAKLNVPKALKMLCRFHFLDTSDKVDDLSEILESMQLPQLQNLTKAFLRSKDTHGTKDELIKGLLQYARSQTSLHGSTTAVVLKRAKKEAGECYRIAEDVYTLFISIWHLFSPKDMSSTNAADMRYSSVSKLINGLIHILRAKASDQLTFVSGTGVRHVHQFPTRKDLRDYIRANMLELYLHGMLENKDYNECESICSNALETLRSLLSDGGQRYLRLPSHLRRYTLPRVLFRIVGHGVTISERQKQYEDAVERLQELITLSDGDWCPLNRSEWYERLALNLDTHLKRRDEALDIIDAALQEDTLTEATRLTLADRAKKILESQISKTTMLNTKAALNLRLTKLNNTVPDVDVVERTIDATLLAKSLGGRMKTIFATVNNETHTVTARNVEEVAKLYYIREHGFTGGIHGEGSPWLLLYGLFFWEIIHDSNVPDAFICSQQWVPSDITDPQFYLRRKLSIDDRLQWIRSSSIEVLLPALRSVWTSHYGKASVLVKWDLFDDFGKIKDLLRCISGNVLAGVFTRLATKYRHYRNGFPDLLLWNKNEKIFKVVEVKGPGDRLAPKQRLWLDFFVKVGASAEVCYVKGISGKRLEQKEVERKSDW